MGKKLNKASGIKLHTSVEIYFTSPCFYSFLLTSISASVWLTWTENLN